MRGEPSCPKCGGRVRAPGLFSDSWQCAVHGAVHPLQPVIPPSVEGLSVVVHRTRVPVWMPWPLPVGWLFTGVASAGDDRSGGRATAVACSGPGPLGGIGELLLIAEELGVGLGARYAGIDGVDPGSSIDVSAPPHAKVVAAGRRHRCGTSTAAPTTGPSSPARRAACGSGRSSGRSSPAC